MAVAHPTTPAAVCEAGVAIIALRQKAVRPNSLYASVSYSPKGGRQRLRSCLRNSVRKVG